MKPIQFTIGDASTEAAFITNAAGYDVATIQRYLPDVHPYLPGEHFIDGDQWQAVIDTIDAAPRLAAACHGLTLPPDIAPGALAALVTAARSLAEAYDLRGYGCGEEAQALEDALAPFTPDPAPPVSPPAPERKPYGYAWKTVAGYLANQGRNHWYESEPVGWAVFTESDHAANLGASLGIAGEAVPVYRD